MSIISVDNNKVLGRIKPVHSCVGITTLSPRSEIKWAGNVLSYMNEMGMPFTRLNGIGGEYGSMTYVDVSNIFRDFDADETVAANYDFTFTDWLVRECFERGIKPIYRLGVTKEKDHWLKAYNIYPPKDYEKFARICERIILHYNSGWNGGYKFDIRQWEIWDGPDNAREIKDNACWKGTKEQYFELYGVVSRKLKKRFPWLQFGGYGASGFNLDDKNDYSSEFLNDFLNYVTAEETKAPFDFFTWNSTSAGVETNAKVAKYVREKLDGAGLTECESICGSWNSKILDCTDNKNASVIADNLIGWQNCQVNKAMYDTCWSGIEYGLFGLTINRQTVPSYGFYAMKAFNALYRLGFQVETISDDEDVNAVSAASFDKVAVMVVNRTSEPKEVEIRLKDVKRNKSTVTIINKVDLTGLTYDDLFNIILPKKALGALKFTMKPNEVRLYEFE